MPQEGPLTDSTVKLWDIKTGECFKVLEGHRGTINSMDILRNPPWFMFTKENLYHLKDLIKSKEADELKNQEKMASVFLKNWFLS